MNVTDSHGHKADSHGLNVMIRPILMVVKADSHGLS